MKSQKNTEQHYLSRQCPANWEARSQIIGIGDEWGQEQPGVFGGTSTILSAWVTAFLASNEDKPPALYLQPRYSLFWADDFLYDHFLQHLIITHTRSGVGMLITLVNALVSLLFLTAQLKLIHILYNSCI